MAEKEQARDEDKDLGNNKGGGSGEGSRENKTGAETPGESSELVHRQGKLLLDATCTPVDIAYPTDLSLLNEAREKLEQIIDELYAPQRGKFQKSRTYRQKTRKVFLLITKQRRANKKKIRKGVGRQLRYVARDLRIVAELSQQTPLATLGRRDYKNLLAIQEIFRQQKWMYEKRVHRVEQWSIGL